MAVRRRSPRTFASPVAADPAARASDRLTPGELAAVDAVARAMALANLSSNTFEGLLGRLGRSRPAEPRLSVP